jgi:NTP pyrophosphatase (non-canonical NTP hydrolase)
VCVPRYDLHSALAHELADCLWSVRSLADAYDIDLEAAFDSTMESLSEALSSRSTASDSSPGAE